MKITKKYVFEQKLKGRPIDFVSYDYTLEELQCLIDCGVLRQFATIPRPLEKIGLLKVLYPVRQWYPVIDDRHQKRVGHAYGMLHFDDVLKLNRRNVV